MSTLFQHLGELKTRCDLCVSNLRETAEASRGALRLPPEERVRTADKIRISADCLRRSLDDLLSHVDSCDKCPKSKMKRVEGRIRRRLRNADKAESILRRYTSQ